MHADEFSFSSLAKDLYQRKCFNKSRKMCCFIQMLTYVGDDLYDEYVSTIQVNVIE
jgi:hypothetical protein